LVICPLPRRKPEEKHRLPVTPRQIDCGEENKGGNRQVFRAVLNVEVDGVQKSKEGRSFHMVGAAKRGVTV